MWFKSLPTSILSRRDSLSVAAVSHALGGRPTWNESVSHSVCPNITSICENRFWFSSWTRLLSIKLLSFHLPQSLELVSHPRIDVWSCLILPLTYLHCVDKTSVCRAALSVHTRSIYGTMTPKRSRGETLLTRRSQSSIMVPPEVQVWPWQHKLKVEAYDHRFPHKDNRWGETCCRVCVCA